MSPKLTHFLCLPLVTPASLPQLSASLARLTEDRAVQQWAGRKPKGTQLPRKSSSETDSESDDGKSGRPLAVPEAYIPKQAIRPVGTLHLTLGVMSLMDSDRVKAASDFLYGLNVGELFDTKKDDSIEDGRQHHSQDGIQDSTSADPTSIDRKHTGSLHIQLKGLQTFAEPEKARILFASPQDSSDRLLSFSQRLRQKFVAAGFIQDEDRELTLHATIINTVYAASIGRKGQKKGKVQFNATDLIERYKDHVWADVEISKITICEMGAKEDDNGDVRYVEVASVDLP